LGKAIPTDAQAVVMNGLGLATMAIGAKMALESRNVLILAASIAVGGLLGFLLGIQPALEAFARWAQQATGGGGRFAEAILTTSILYCVGPMTLLGCIQDGIEGKSDLLALKSTLDGIGAVFFAAALGPGVLVTALVILLFQGTLTAFARPLSPLAKDVELLAEMTAVGGLMMLAIGLGLADVAKLSAAHYLPALFVAPGLAALARGMSKERKSG
jgi:uncharacterized membrane protein YqgA involved in biofilm formation